MFGCYRRKSVQLAAGREEPQCAIDVAPFDLLFAPFASLFVVLLGVRKSKHDSGEYLFAETAGGDILHDRFNVGQKINAILTAAFTILFFASGLFLWLGERDTRFRFASTVVLHDGLMFVALFLLVGHLYLALIHPATRHALRGITVGTVSEDWAARHHAKWKPE